MYFKYTVISSTDLRHCLPCKIAVDVSKDFHEVRMDRGEGHAGRLAHVDGAFLSQVHVVEVDELKLRLFLWPTTTVLRDLVKLRYSITFQCNMHGRIKAVTCL